MKTLQAMRKHKCHWCQEMLLPLTCSSSTSEVYHSALGSVFSKSSKGESKHSFYFAKCAACNLSQVVSSSQEKQLGALNKSILYKEPEQHHHHIVSCILNKLPQQEQGIEICCMSNKDSILASKIQSARDESKNISVKTGLDKSLEADITLATRWLEHCNNSEDIHSLFSNIAINGILVIESLNYQDLFNTGNHSFAWDERISYFDLAYIKAFSSYYGFEELLSFNEDSQHESFWVIILQKKEDARGKGSEKGKINSHLAELNHSRVNIEKSLSIIQQRCKQYVLLEPSQVCFIGIGHKAQFAAAMLKSIDVNIEIKLYDSSPSKIGTYWGEKMIHDIDDLFSTDVLPRGSHYVFAFSGILAQKLQQRLKNKDSGALFTHILDWYKESY